MKFVRKHINEAVRLPSAGSQKKITLADIRNVNDSYYRQQIYRVINKVLNTSETTRYTHGPTEDWHSIYFTTNITFPHEKTEGKYKYDFSPAILDITAVGSAEPKYNVQLAIIGSPVLVNFTDMSSNHKIHTCLYIDELLDYIVSHSDNIIKNISLCYIPMSIHTFSDPSLSKDMHTAISNCGKNKYDMSKYSIISGMLKLPLCSNYDISLYDSIFKFLKRIDNIDFSHTYNIAVGSYLTSTNDHDIVNDLYSMVQKVKENNIVCDCISHSYILNINGIRALLSVEDFTYMLDIANNENEFYIELQIRAFLVRKDYNIDIKWPILADADVLNNFYKQLNYIVKYITDNAKIRYYIKSNTIVAVCYEDREEPNIIPLIPTTSAQ